MSVEENSYASRFRIKPGHTFVKYKVKSKGNSWKWVKGKGAENLKKLLQDKIPFLMVFEVPSDALKKIEDEQNEKDSKTFQSKKVKLSHFGNCSSSSELQQNGKFEDIKWEIYTESFEDRSEENTSRLGEDCTYVPCSKIGKVDNENDAVAIKTEEKRMGVSRNLRVKDNGELKVGDEVRVYEEDSKDWLFGEVYAVGADGAVWVSCQDKLDKLVNVRCYEGKIYRPIPDDKMSIKLSIEIKGLETKVRVTFDRWTTRLDSLRRFLAEECKKRIKDLRTEDLQILLNKQVLKNNKENNDRLVMSILTHHGWHNRCCLALIQIDPLSYSGEAYNSSEPEGDGPSTEGGPAEETYDSEEIGKYSNRLLICDQENKF